MGSLFGNMDFSFFRSVFSEQMKCSSECFNSDTYVFDRIL